MRLEARRLLDQVLVSETPCLGAVFCSYTFDPAYFEDHVLRALLRLQGDPEEDGVRYHEEARSALRETPVACFIDASVRSGGRRLPYDLLLVRRRTFHPKVILVLYEGEARLAVGSGNTTKPGFEQNAELFFTRTLRYDNPADAALLRSVEEFLEGCASLATHRGTQLGLVRSALAARISATPAPAPGASSDLTFVHTFQSSMLEALAEVLPQDARLRRVGVLSPFFEQDDVEAADDTEGLSSVLSALLQLRASETPTFDIGVPWEDAPLAPSLSGPLPSLEAEQGRLWAWRRREPVEGGWAERLEYLVVDRVTQKRVEARDATGQPCRYEREALQTEISEGRFWPVAQPTVHAPKRILQRIAAEYPAQLWLHPTATLSTSGRASRRPLHAKLLLLTVTRRGRTWTYGLAGSANASRAALSRSVAQGGNVEAGILFCLEGEVLLHDFLPTLVSHPIDSVQLEEREPLVADVDFSAWIDDVVHDAAARTLTVHWSQEGGPQGLGAWEWRYLDRSLARGDGPGSGAVVLAEFDLAAASAELEFRTGGREWFLPIRVADLAALPSSPHLTGLGVRELLALLGRRVGQERLATLREQRGPPGVATVLDAVFGEGFGPTDVFKAWWGLNEDLNAAPTVAAFRYRLLGPMGARAAWAGLRELPGEQLSGDEVWVYGCELLRELQQLELADGPDRAAKQELLAEFLASLRADLVRLTPPSSEHPWIRTVIRFYGLEESHGGT